MTDHAIGVDVGGSKIAACLIDGTTSRVIETVRVPTRPERGGEAVLRTCVSTVDSLLAAAHLEPANVPLGIGLCELVTHNGAISSAATVDWREIDVAAAFPMPRVAIESDVRAAALAEARLGAGRGRASFVYLSVGTGIGFTLVLDGRPYAGAHGGALILGSPPVEDVSSGTAIASAAGVATAEEAFAGTRHRGVVARAAQELGRAMAWLVNALDPHAIVVGGGLGLRSDYRDAATAVMHTHLEARECPQMPVVPAELGGAAGAIGAALVARDRHVIGA